MIRKFSHNQAFDVGSRGLVVLGTCSIVADLRISKDDNLTGIRRVGEYFLVAGERRIEDDFTGPLSGRAKTPACKDGTVFQGEDR